MFIQQSTSIHKKINHTHFQYYGGFFDYFKLTLNLWKINLQTSKHLNLFSKNLLFLKLFFISLYLIFIKPFLQFFSIKTSIKGHFKSIDYQIPQQHYLNKYVSVQLFNIPLFFFKSKLTNEDWHNLLK